MFKTPVQYSRMTKRTTSLTSGQAGRLYSAWSQGKAKKSGPVAPQALPAWRQGLQAQFAQDQTQIINEFIYYVGKARQFASQGDYNASIQLFAVAQRMSNDPRLDRQSRLLCISEMQAAEAYLDFVTGDFGGARKRLEAAIAADEALEAEFGHSVLHIHRIHLANNAVKVEAGAHNLPGALALAANILAYVQGTVEAIAIPARWGSAWKTALTQEPQLFLIKQTSAEIACAMAGLFDEGACSAWMESLATTVVADCPQAGSEIVNWYSTKTAFLRAMHRSKDEVQIFCEAAEEYLAEGPREARLLWHMACFDVLQLCGDSASANASLLQLELGESLRQANDLPRQVRARIAQSLPNTEALQLQQA